MRGRVRARKRDGKEGEREGWRERERKKEEKKKKKRKESKERKIESAVKTSQIKQLTNSHPADKNADAPNSQLQDSLLCPNAHSVHTADLHSLYKA